MSSDLNTCWEISKRIESQCHLTIIHQLCVRLICLSVCLIPGTAITAAPIATKYWVCNPGTPCSKIGYTVFGFLAHPWGGRRG